MCKPRNEGFTLIEMMAVMVLIGIMSSLVLPSMQRWFSGLETRIEAGELAARLQRLYTRTALLSQDFVLTPKTLGTPLADGAAALALPPGWALAEGSALSLAASGLCGPGSLTLRSRTHTLVLNVAGGDCEVSVRQVVP